MSKSPTVKHSVCCKPGPMTLGSRARAGGQCGTGPMGDRTGNRFSLESRPLKSQNSSLWGKGGLSPEATVEPEHVQAIDCWRAQ